MRPQLGNLRCYDHSAIGLLGILFEVFLVIVFCFVESFERFDLCYYRADHTIMSKVTRFSGNYDGDREEMIGKIYHDALAHLVGKPDLLPGAIRSLLLRGKKARSKK